MDCRGCRLDDFEAGTDFAKTGGDAVDLRVKRR
jgi:hypothetical protein